MSCDFCAGKIFKEKLGRCKQCMVINLLLLMIAIGFYFWIDLDKLLAVQLVALFMFIAACSILMIAHLIAWCFHRWRGDH
jgi:hypothetical protein